MTGELRTLLPPFGKATGVGPLGGLPVGIAQGVGLDNFALYSALRAARMATAPGAQNYLVSWPFDISNVDGSLFPPLTNSRLMAVPQLVPPGQAIDGVMFVQGTAGVYTAANSNQVGAYSFDGTTFTRVGVSASNGNLWKGAAGLVATPFNVQVPAAGGWRLLWAAAVWNQSAVTTTPTIGGVTVGGGGIGANSPGLGPFAFQVDQAGNNNLPATFAGVTAGDTNHEWLAFYRNHT